MKGGSSKGASDFGASGGGFGDENWEASATGASTTAGGESEDWGNSASGQPTSNAAETEDWGASADGSATGEQTFNKPQEDEKSAADTDGW